MLKKVFISLLILSALTSEGVNNTPLDLYSIYVRYAALLDMNTAEDMSFDSMSEEDVDFVMLSEIEQDSIVTPDNIKYEKLILKNDSSDFTATVDFSLDYSINEVPDKESNLSDRRAIVQWSDSSPPYFCI